MMNFKDNLLEKLIQFFGNREAVPEELLSLCETSDEGRGYPIGDSFNLSEGILLTGLRETVFNVFFTLDETFHFTYLSPSSTAIFGYAPEDLLQKPLSTLLPEGNTKGIYNTLDQVLRDGVMQVVAEDVKRHDGNLCHFEFNLFPIYEHDVISGIECMARDITHRKRVEDDLLKSRELLRVLSENSSDVITIIDINGNILFESPSLQRQYGFLPKELVGQNAFTYVDPEDMPKVIETFREILTHQGVTYSGDLRLKHKNGSMKYTHIRAINLLKEPLIKGILLIYNDITDYKNVINHLRDSEARYRTLVEQANDAIAILQDNRIKYVNPRFLTLLDRNEDQLLEHRLIEFVHPDDLGYFKTLGKKQMLGEGIPSIIEIALHTGKGIKIDVEINLSHIPYSSNTADLVILRDITERRKTEHEIRDAYQLHKFLNDNISDVVLVFELLTMRFSFITPSLSDLLGYSLDEAMNMNPEDFLPPYSRNELSKRIETLLHGYETHAGMKEKLISAMDLELCKKDGTLIWIELKARLLKNNEGKFSKILAVVRDISERKRIENELKKSEEHLRLLIETSTDIIYRMDNNGCFTYISPRFTEISGHPVDELLSKHYSEFIIHDEVPILQNYIRSRSSRDDNSLIEISFCLPDEPPIPLELNLTPMFGPNNQPLGILGIARDIRGRKRSERELHEANLLFRLLAENSADVIWTLDLNFHPLYISPSCFSMTGYSVEEISSLKIEKLLPGKSLEQGIEIFQKEMLLEQSGTADPSRTRTWELEFVRKDGTLINIEANIRFIRDKTGKSIGFVGISRDITERVKTEQALKAREEKYRFILEPIQDGYYESSFDGTISHVNQSFCDIVGYSPEELIGQRYNLLSDEENTRLVYNWFHKVYKKGKPLYLPQAQLIRKDGEKIFCDASIALNLNDLGQRIGFCGIVRNITNKVNQETALMESERKYRTILARMVDGYYEVDLYGRCTNFNDKFCQLVGLHPQDIRGRSYKDFISEKDLIRVKNSFHDIVLTGKPIAITLSRFLHRDGDKISERFGEGSASPMYDPKGKITGFYGIIRDVTDRIRYQEAIRESENRFRSILETIEDGYFEVNNQGDFTFVNASMSRLLGYSMEELVGMNNRQYMDEFNASKIYSIFNRVHHSGVPQTSFSWQVTRKDGEKRYLESSVSLRQDVNGDKIGFSGIVRDITDRLRYYEKMSLLNECFVSFGTSPLENINLLTELCSKLFPADMVLYHGIKDDRMLKVSCWNVPDDAVTEDFSDRSLCCSVFFNNNTDMIHIPDLDQSPYADINPFIKKVGIKTHVGVAVRSASGFIGSLCLLFKKPFVLMDEDRRFLGIISSAIGVEEERKTMEESLRTIEERYRIITDNVSDVIWTMDMNLKYTFISPSVLHFSGFTAEEEMNLGMEKVLTPDSVQKAYKYYLDELSALEDGKDKDPFRMRNLELEQYCKDGSLITMDVSVTFIRDEESRPIGILGVSRNITERKKMEEALRKSEEDLRRRNLSLEKDLKTAQIIQKALISGRTHAGAGLKIDYRYIPLEAIGGDYFAITELKEGGTGVFLGDVSNHGVTAALFLSLIKATTDRICRNFAKNPRSYMISLNHELIHNMPYSFLTAIYGVFYRDELLNKMVFRFSSAGHPYPIIYHASTGEVQELVSRGPLIGIIENIDTEEKTVTLEPGDRIILYTDGIPETMNSQRTLLGFDRLPELLKTAGSLPMNSVLDHIMHEIDSFRGKRPHADDIVIILFEIE